MEEQNTKFEGWAVVELYGHQKEVGFVTTRYFGSACLFQVDVPELAERDVTITSPQYIASQWTPAGSVIRKSAVPARTRFVGPNAIYAMNPCSEAIVRRAIEEQSRGIAVVQLADAKQLPVGNPGQDESIDRSDEESVDLDSSTGE